MLTICQTAIEKIKESDFKPRTHSKKQIRQMADSMTTFGFVNPILTDEEGVIIAGHGRKAAAEFLGFKEVPTIVLRGLSPAKRRALAIADNKIAANAGWDRELLATVVPELAQILILENIDISITGFTPVEIDQLANDFEEQSIDPADNVDSPQIDSHPVTKRGDVYVLGKHRLLCGDARNPDHVSALMDGCTADMAFLDPPYNVRIRDIVGRGQVKHSEFAMASGEYSREEFVHFLKATTKIASGVSREGAVHFVCMDWRHIAVLVEAGAETYEELLNIAVWVKSTPGQGSFYRSQHELVGVFRVGAGPHLNNIQLGRHGRNRSNVWHYAGANTFRAGRMEDLKSHPTVKPVGLICDAMRDCTRRGDIVLDTFSGSGTTILAAERVGRRAFALELEPKFVDAAIRRWQEFTRKDAIHLISGRSFDEIAADPIDSPSEIPQAA